MELTESNIAAIGLETHQNSRTSPRHVRQRPAHSLLASSLSHFFGKPLATCPRLALEHSDAETCRYVFSPVIVGRRAATLQLNRLLQDAFLLLFSLPYLSGSSMNGCKLASNETSEQPATLARSSRVHNRTARIVACRVKGVVPSPLCYSVLSGSVPRPSLLLSCCLLYTSDAADE